MKRIFFLLLAFVTVVVTNAQQVSRQQALQKARQFMPGKQFGETRSFARKGSVSDSEPLYIFNAEDKKGYVIVSGDDRTRPILGYAEQGNLEESQMPENMKWWLDNLASQIEAIGTSLKPAGVASTSSARQTISPLIKTQWNQGAPYNYQCPDGNYLDKGDEGYDANNLCVTGCVATAMAQVMYYWQWPTSCQAIDSYSIGYYDQNWNFIETGRVKGVPATTFKWDKMKAVYAYQETGEAADAVAELMRYCGQAVSMGYGTGSSGAYLSPSALASVFNYSKNIRELSRDNYTTAQWEELVYEELSADTPRPVLYAGQTSNNEGHQFIVDGYNSDGLFHMNWGWGYGGSYSVLSVADPDTEQGIGGSSNNGAFQYRQTALLGVKPAEADEVMLPVLYSVLDEFLTKTYTRTGADANFSDVALKADVQSQYSIAPVSAINVQVGWGLYQDDSFISCLASTAATIPNEQWSYFGNEQTVSFGKNLAAGTYQLSQIYRFSDSEQWKRCENYGTESLVAEVSATSLTVRKRDLDNMSFTVNRLTTSEQPEVGNVMTINLNVTNTGESSTIVLNLWMQKSGEDTWNNVTQTEYYVGPGESADIKVDYTPTESGSFTLKATGTNDEALATTTVTIAATEIVTIDGLSYLCTPLYQRATVMYDDDPDRSVRSITIRQTVTAGGVDCQVKAIADGALQNYWNVSQIEIPEGVESVGNNALSYCGNLKQLILPSTLNSIGEYAFYDNSSLEVVVSHIVKPCVLTDHVFKTSKWNSQTDSYEYFTSSATLYVPIGTKSAYETAGWTTHFSKVEEGELKEGTDGLLKYSYSTGGSEATVIQDDSYKTMTEVVIPATATLDGKTYQVTAIGSNAFQYCHSLNSVTLPEGLVSIGKYSFQATSISSLTLPSTLKTIDNYAFYDMSNLQRVELPSSLTSIGEYAFFYNQNLSSVVSRITEPFDISENVFASSSTWDDVNHLYIYSPSPAKLYVPVGTKSLYEAAKGWNMFAAIEEGELKEGFDGVLKYSYSTGNSVATVIQDDSYKKMTEVVIPATATLDGKTYQVTAIGNNAFQFCYDLTSVTLSEGLVSIGNNAFQNTKISSLTLPSTLKTIGSSAFEDCYSITSFVIPEGVEKVGRYAFAYMYKLQKITLPSTLTEIGERLLVSNGELTEVVSYISEPFEVEDYTFTYSSSWNSQMGQYEYIPSKATLYVPKGKAATYSTTAGWNWFQGIKELTSTVSGDADGDGSVDAADVQMIVNYIMGRNPVGFIFDNANVNGDAEVNAADLVLVIKMMPKE